MRSRSCMSQRIWCWSALRAESAPSGGSVAVLGVGTVVGSGLVRYAGGVSEGGGVVCSIWAVKCRLIVIIVIIVAVVVIVCRGNGGLVLLLLSGVGVNAVRS